MQSENATQGKDKQLQPREAQIRQQNNQQHSLLSPQRTSIEKYPPEVTAKTSQQLLNQILFLLQSKQQIVRKDSIKSADRKDSNGVFKCKCKKTKCLKMYCECFALGKLCNGCLCTDCQNLLQFQQVRASAIDEAFQRDPDIFKTNSVTKKGGCICKKTGCLKKYCECFSSGVACTSECKCQNCSNTY